MSTPSTLISELTPEMARAMESWSRSGAPGYARVGAEGSRAAYRRSTARGAWEPTYAVDTSDIVLGDRSPARVYRPRETDTSPTPIVYLHGGGFVMGDLDTHDSVCKELSGASGLPVIAVDYPLAPEHPFPAAPDFALGLIETVIEAAPGLGVDGERVVLAGDSAGACLAAVMSIGARERQRIAAQCLFYPATDLHCDTASFRDIASGYPVTGPDGLWFTQSYLPSPDLAEDWRASPLLAESVAMSPPTFLLTVGHDPLRDEGLAFGDRLEDQGVRVVRRHMPAHVHGFLTNGAAVPEARTELAFAAGFVRGVLLTQR
ncbi:alpha/beta hydrolase [Microbacterium sp.]|jgi:acetyl esterase|uniref:alpha/beta hydrolase n=1 Tax=Microbacterium sp. TaxID=51671 RepID=UPI0037CBA1C3